MENLLRTIDSSLHLSGLVGAIYRSALFVSGALLFIVQPMLAKMILPIFGGSPAVWNTCIFFFQATLLAGYLYAHFGAAWLGIRGHQVLHIILLFLTLVVLPVGLSANGVPALGVHPAISVSWALVLSVGLPFFLISATSPTLQNWFANTSHPAAKDPYFLYMASNLGSLVGLLAYPLYLEPTFLLSTQSWIWTLGFMFLLLLITLCSFTLRRSLDLKDGESTVGHSTSVSTEDPIASPRRVKWLALAFVPATLLPSTTSYLSADIASVPFLWAIPLSLYLLSFVLVFAKATPVEWGKISRVLHFLILGSAITIFSKATQPAWLIALLHLGTFLAIALTAHGNLAQDRPSPRRLTEYYLYLSLGGVLGGAFNVFLAPWLFKGVEEYPLALVMAALLLIRPLPNASPSIPWQDFVFPLTLGVLLFGLTLVFQGINLNPWLSHFVIFGLAGIVCISFSRIPTRFALGLLALMLGTRHYSAAYGEALRTDRSFFGVYRVTADNDKQFRYLFHGTTLHGAQNRQPNLTRQPLAYYFPTGPIGQLFSALSTEGQKFPVAVIGLGTGSLACYGQEGQEWTFYEIDPLVGDLASDPRFFTFLRDCGRHSRIVYGDARITLNSAPAKHFGLIILDAFSGDAIPIHLLTREAVMLYLEKLAPAGLMAFHVSSRHFDLAPIVARLASELNLASVAADDQQISAVDKAAGKTASRWIILARHKNSLAHLEPNPMWKPLRSDPAYPIWTDNYSNILPVLRW